MGRLKNRVVQVKLVHDALLKDNMEKTTRIDKLLDRVGLTMGTLSTAWLNGAIILRLEEANALRRPKITIEELDEGLEVYEAILTKFSHGRLIFPTKAQWEWGWATRKGIVKKKEFVFGVVHIYASSNNTFVHVTDLSGLSTRLHLVSIVVASHVDSGDWSL